MNNKRIRIVMDENREIKPDMKNNYVMGEWDKTMERAVETAMIFNRNIFVIRPEGVNLTIGEL